MTLTIQISDDLQPELEAAAQADGKSVAAVCEDATRRYLAHLELDELVRYCRRQAQKPGIKSEDVLRLIDESRSGC